MLKKILITSLLIISFQSTAYAQIALSYGDNPNVFSVDPGDTIETDFIVRNSNKNPTQVSIYVVDGTSTSDGSFAAKLREDEQLIFGQWAKVDEETIELGYQESKNIKLTIEIPENATPGDYSGGVIAQRIIEPEQDADDGGTGVATGLSFSTRMAKAYYISITGDRISKANIGELTYKKSSGNQYKMFLNLENNGNTTIKFYINPSLTPLYGEKEDLPEIVIDLLPKEQSSLEIHLGDMPLFGVYELAADIKYNEFNLVSKRETPLGDTSLSTQLIIIPWLQVAIVAIIIFAIVLFIVLSKLKTSKIIKASKKYKVKQGDTLATLAKSNSVNWKTIAKINNLKQPYEINAGQEILMPKKGE